MTAASLSTSHFELRIFPLLAMVWGPDGPACSCRDGASCRNIGKHPAVAWLDYDENERGSAGDYGIRTGSVNGIFVVDVDMKDGKDGAGALLSLAAGRALPETLSVLTPTGGVHLYFRLPPGVYVPNRQALAEGVDVRGEGGYVVGPGSKHKNGGVYEEAGGELADPPEWLLALVAQPIEAPKPMTQHVVINPATPAGERAITWAREFLARAEPAIEGQHGSDRFFAVACHLMYSALPLETLHALVVEVYNPRCVPPWSDKEIAHKLEDADQTADEPRGLCSPDFLLRLAGRSADTELQKPDALHEYTFEPGMRSSCEAHKTSFGEIAGDLFDHADWAGVLYFDTFRDRVVAVNPPMRLDAETKGLSDNDVQLVRAWLEYHGKRAHRNDVQAAIEVVARRRAVDPRQRWLASLEWDGVPRLDGVLPDYFQTANTAYERGIGPRWFVSLVARAMQPGCQSDCTLILEGPQGIGKTSAFRSLMPQPEWYADTSSGVDHKDFKQNLLGIWLMAFDELDSLSKASLTKVKTELSSTRDHYRKSFGHYADGYPRTVGFCGSTNQDTYFNDSTGARRFWPCKVLRLIDVGAIVADRDQLWAEAFRRWQRGEAWHVNTPELQALCESEQEARLELDPWEEDIRTWLFDSTKVSFEPLNEREDTVFKGVRRVDASQGVTTGIVLEKAIGKDISHCTPGDTQRVGRALRRIGLERVRIRFGKSLEWRFVFPHT